MRECTIHNRPIYGNVVYVGRNSAVRVVYRYMSVNIQRHEASSVLFVKSHTNTRKILITIPVIVNKNRTNVDNHHCN